MPDDEKKSGLISQVISAVVVAILVGGTSPWWYNEFFKKPTTQNGSSSSPTPTSSSSIPETLAPSVPDISGRWFNASLNSNSVITQNGNRFQFTTRGTALFGTPFQSTGGGTLTVNSFVYEYKAQYQSGMRSDGECSGVVSADGMRMTSTCTDSVFGTFVSSAVRQ